MDSDQSETSVKNCEFCGHSYDDDSNIGAHGQHSKGKEKE